MKILTLLAIVFSLKSAFAAHCTLKIYYLDNAVRERVFIAADKYECFNEAMNIYDIPNIESIVGHVETTNYVSWEYNDGWIDDSDGYINRHSRECLEREDIIFKTGWAIYDRECWEL